MLLQSQIMFIKNRDQIFYCLKKFQRRSKNYFLRMQKAVSFFQKTQLYQKTNQLSIYSAQNRGICSKLFTFPKEGGILYVFQHNRAAEWAVHFVQPRNMGLKAILLLQKL